MKKYSVPILLFVLCFGFTLVNSKHFFFWDNIVQISVPANWYYDNNFKNFFLPDDIATGHPPFLGLYLAFIWKLFGRSLLVSHFAFFPFVFGITYQIYLLLKKSNLIGIKILALFTFVILDPTLLSQMSLVTFETAHIFFYLLSINSIINNKPLTLSLSFTALCLTSLRGTLSGLGIILFWVLYKLKISEDKNIKKVFLFFPGLFAIGIFLLLFYFEKKWVIHNVISDRWKESAEFASVPEIFRNTGLFAWRLIDFGRVGVWSIFAWMLAKFIYKMKVDDKFIQILLLVTLAQVIVLFPVIVIYKNPFNHRYLLPIIIPVAIVTGYWILTTIRNKLLWFSLVFLILLSGNFWIYPLKIAQGWDSTPAHWPYYNIRKEMIKKIASSNISFTEVGSFFPNIASTKFIDLSETDMEFTEANLKSDKFILYSNVYNVDDEYIDELFNEKKWQRFIEERRGRIFMILFIKKE